MGPDCQWEQYIILVGIVAFPVYQTDPGFALDRDSQVQGTNDSDLKFKIHFAEPLRIQSLK
jgi:hypothetical protein